MNRILISISMLFIFGTDFYAQTPGALPTSYDIDAYGWSIITPSSDSRLIYVSTSGNDATAQT